MKTVGDLKQAVKRFVYNNSSAVDLFQGENDGCTQESMLDDACLRAANNARLWAERNANFDWLNTTVSSFFPVGMGINLDRLYEQDAAFDVSVETADWWYARWDGSGVLWVGIRADQQQFWSTTMEPDQLQSFELSVAITVAGESIPAQLLTIESYHGQLNLDAVQPFNVYRVYFHSKAVSRPTAWEDLDGNLYGPGYFSTYFRMNAFTMLELDNQDGTTYPMDVDTKKSKNIQDTQRLGRGYDDVVQNNTTLPEGVIDNRTLKLSYQNDKVEYVKISGSKWLPDYTMDSDSDPLITEAFDFMMWQMILELNHIVQIYVSRVEGSLSPPEKARNEAWAGVVTNEAFKAVKFYQQ